MDKRTLELRAKERKRQKELVDRRKKEKEDTAREILKTAEFFKRFVNDKRYKKFTELLRQRQNTLIHSLIWLEESKPHANALQSEKLRAQIQTIERILTAPGDFFDADKEIRKVMPEMAKEKEED